MYAVATFLIVAVFTMVFGRLATGALIATGLPPEVATFQARSAFSGAGFTTTEAENVVNHPTRRKIISAAMFVGSLGTPTLVVAILVGFVAPGPGSTTERTLVTIAGIVLILMIITNRPVQRLLVGVGHRYANQRLIPAFADEMIEMLELGEEFSIGSIRLVKDPGETYRSLKGLAIALPDVRVLGVRRDNHFFGEAPVDIQLRAGDELVVYGRWDQIQSVGRDLA